MIRFILFKNFVWLFYVLQNDDDEYEHLYLQPLNDLVSFPTITMSMIITCWYKIKQKIFLPLPLHLDPEASGRDALPRQLDHEVLLLNWPHLSSSRWR